MSEEDYEIVQRPSRQIRLTGPQRSDYPIEAIVASADSGTAVRLYAKDEPSQILQKAPDGSGKLIKKKATTARGHLLTGIRFALRRRGYELEWSRDATSRDHILVWAIRREEG